MITTERYTVDTSCTSDDSSRDAGWTGESMDEKPTLQDEGHQPRPGQPQAGQPDGRTSPAEQAADQADQPRLTEPQRYEQAIATGQIGTFERYDDILRRAAEYAAVGYGGLVVNIFSRTGELGLIFARRGCQVIALDPSAEMLEASLSKARSAGVDRRIRHLRVPQPFLSLPLESDTADAVVSAFGLHAVPEQDKPQAICELARVLRPGGTLVLADTMFPDEDDRREALRMYPQQLEDLPFADLSRLAVYFADAGLTFRCEQMTVVNWVVWGHKKT